MFFPGIMASGSRSTVDPLFSNVTLLFSGNGVDESTSFIDNSSIGRTITGVGSGKIDTTTDPYTDGLGTYQQFGVGDYLSTPYVLVDFDWWTSDWTIESWVYATSWANWQSPLNNRPMMIGNNDPAGPSQYWGFGPLNSGLLEWYYWRGSQEAVTGTTVLATSTWHHIAMTHRASDGQIDLFVNGVNDATGNVVGTPQSSASFPILIGRANGGGINGRVADLRITKGVKRYAATFIPNSTRFPTA